MIDAFGQIVLTPSRVIKLIDELQSHESANAKRAKGNTAQLKKELAKVDKGITNLYAAIEVGAVELDGQLKARIANQKTRREALIAQIANLAKPRGIPKNVISNDNIKAFCEAFKTRLAKGAPEFKKTYLRLFIDRVEVDIPNKEIRLSGPKSAVLGAFAAGKAGDPDRVLTSVQEWRPRRDSNP